MKLAFFGTPKISAYVLENLIKEYEVSWVLSQPDKGCVRGRRCIFTPVKQLAIENGIEVFQPERISRKFFNENIINKKVDLIIVLAYGQYIPTYMIDFPKYYTLNMHLSLLPKYRGAAPVQRAIINGDNYSGVTIMKVSKKMDTGDILYQSKIDIDINDDNESYTCKLIDEGISLLKKAINNIDKLTFTSQDDCLSSYAPKITKEDAKYTWEEEAISIHNKVRVMSKCPGILARVSGKVFKIMKTKCVEYEGEFISKYSSSEIIKVDKELGLFIKCKNSVLLIEEVQVLGKRKMKVRDFLNGLKLEEKMRLEVL